MNATVNNYLKSLKWVSPVYTGGGIYVAYGAMKDGTFFVASDDMYDVRFVNADPTQKDEYYEIVGDDTAWQEAHLVRDVNCETEGLDIWEALITWVLKYKPCNGDLFCNYSECELEHDLSEIKELRNKKNWR